MGVNRHSNNLNYSYSYVYRSGYYLELDCLLTGGTLMGWKAFSTSPSHVESSESVVEYPDQYSDLVPVVSLLQK